ncbi:ATP-binding cassette sub-family A member 17 [Trichonephila clavata]|uniref:ATP-binding cassette sub-family A member 17 n=1 Tax=Trichonephila clavata TaxID=2740835 RepID=A0A8X6HG67_TRICU|nr:ATP-binding cassette sub-family A member 17 [Trichonephila clavata]
MIESSDLRQIFILIYKGLLCGKHQRFSIFFGILFSVFIVCIPCIILSEFNFLFLYRPVIIQQSNDITYPPFDPYYTKESRDNDLQFVYAPEGPITDQFMKDAIKMFKATTDYTGNITSKGTRNEKELASYCLHRLQDDSKSIVIGTILKDFENKLPKSLNYKIRYHSAFHTPFFHTDLKYRLYGPSLGQAYTNTFFLSWQTAVEETFINGKLIEYGKSDFDYKIWMQRFPYPKYKKPPPSFSIVDVVPWFIGYGYLVFFVNVVYEVIEEKVNGSKELLKRMGMTDFTYWASTFMNHFITALITFLIITIVYKAPLKYGVVFLNNSNFLLVFLLLYLYLASQILFCMLFSIFFNRTLFAIISFLVVYVMSLTFVWIQFFMNDRDKSYLPLSLETKLGICLLPPGALNTLFFFVSFYEASGEGLQWYNLTEFSLAHDLNVLMIMGTMAFSCVLFILGIWYFDSVWPWQREVHRPFYFLCLPSYWMGANPISENKIKLFKKNDDNADFFEKEPRGSIPRVIIQNLTKEFCSGFTYKKAVNNVSLNIYQGQITVLLGHNGAGKTTLINTLTGLYSPTSGTASVNGLDILTGAVKARRGFGVCPQHTVLYDALTVEEHLKFYAAMKGVQWLNLDEEVTRTLNMVKLTEPRTKEAKVLSFGMKRKLSLGIAIIGGSKVLFLDEPTLGLDVETRRSVWDALLEIKHSRTIILTTHYMDEANILGDRIAFMADGEIRCCGSPKFLKEKFGTGYHLHVGKNSHFELEKLLSILKSYVPDVKIGNELEKEISFSLPSNSDREFGDMFKELENQKQKLGVTSFGITVTTMEDVFINIANLSETRYKLCSESEDSKVQITMEDVCCDSSNLRPHPRFSLQFFGLLMKRFHYSKRHWSILIAQLAIPFLLTCFCLYSLKDFGTKNQVIYNPLKLDISSVYGDTDGFVYNKNPQLSQVTEYLKDVLESNKVNVETVDNPTHYILDYSKNGIFKFLKNFMVGGAIDMLDDKILNLTAWYNGEHYHTAPMSLLLMHTAVLKYITNTGSITLINEPFPQLLQFFPDISISDVSRKTSIFLMPLALSFLSASFVLLPIHERSSKSKLLQLMTGLPAVIYWIAMFFWDYLVWVVASIFLIIPFAVFAHYAFFGIHLNAIGTTLLLLLLYGWSSIPFSYLITFFFKKGSTGFSAVVVFCTVFGVVAGTFFKSTEFSISSTPEHAIHEVKWFFRIFPVFCFSEGISNLFEMAYSNAFCDSLSQEDLEFNCNSHTMDESNRLFQCCKNKCQIKDQCLTQRDLITWNSTACGRDILSLFVCGLYYFFLLFLFETTSVAAFYQNIKAFASRVRNLLAGLKRDETIIEDSDVLAEKDRITKLIATGGTDGEALVVSGLTKVYKDFYAVNNLTFGIHPEECFGLFGVNGAGKTTLFKMLTGDIIPTKGNAIILNSSIRKDLKKFESNFGYCPQSDALIDRLTGREMLTLFGRLRGLAGCELHERVEHLLKMANLAEHADKQTQYYSGGNKRKLSVTLSLIGSPPLILLDEPTAGVDLVSRRKIWNILSQARKSTGTAVILTTHSVEEREALCDRLAIMVNGHFRCLGSVQQLKSRYGQGYTVIIKMKREHWDNQNVLNDIKRYVQSNLTAACLKDAHQGMLQYHVGDPFITLSYLFKFMADMKYEFNLEDYLISDTSLEQIFLTFARAQR